MKWLAKKMFTLLAIVFIIVSIYFIITIVGNRHEIIEAYNRITYTKQEGADNMRANFLQVYSTYGEDLLIALGIKKSDFAISGAADSPSENPEEHTPFCVCTGPDKCNDSHIDSNCRACIHDVTLCEVIQGQSRPLPQPSLPPPQNQFPVGNNFTTRGPDGLGIILQSTPSFDYYGNPNSGLSIKDAGCGILAAYFAYANNGGQKSFEETILQAFSDRVEVKNGAIYNKPGKGFSMGLNTPDWKHYCRTLGLNISGRGNGIPTEPGDYIFRYTYDNSGQHNIFVRINADRSYQAACSANKSWQETINRKGFNPQYFMKVNK